MPVIVGLLPLLLLVLLVGLLLEVAYWTWDFLAPETGPQWPRTLFLLCLLGSLLLSDFRFPNAQYSPPARRNCWVASCRRRDATVASAVWTHPSAVVTQFTIPYADKWRHNDVIVEKVIKIHEYYTTQLIRMLTNIQRHFTSYFYSIGYRIVNSVTADGCVHIAESAGSRRELVANSCTHRRRRCEAARQFRPIVMKLFTHINDNILHQANVADLWFRP